MLKGTFAGKRECHIAFDWVLVYEVVGDVIKLLRTGTHAEVLDCQLFLHKPVAFFVEQLNCFAAYFACVADAYVFERMLNSSGLKDVIKVGIGQAAAMC